MRKKKFWRNKNKNTTNLNITHLLPNTITLIAICCGLTSIKYALAEKWELSVMAIFFAAFFDVIDGALARMLKATSEFGAQLDSLSDFISFGVAPGFIIYLWSLNNFGFLGWGSAIVYMLCIVIRLARFNAEAILKVQKYEWQKMFFKGVPSPACGMLLMMPLIIELSDFGMKNLNSKQYIIPYAIFIGFLAVSNIHAFSVKKIKIQKDSIPSIMLFVGFIIMLLITYPWDIIPIFLISYLLSIPISILKYKKLSNQQKILEGDLQTKLQ